MIGNGITADSLSKEAKKNAKRRKSNTSIKSLTVKTQVQLMNKK